MKKKVLAILSILVLFSGINTAYSKNTSSELTEAIKLYKAGNYSQCHTQLEEIVKNDPSNALAYYYLGMTATQLGRKGEAILNYDRAITLTPRTNNLKRYAEKGKRCLETPDKCEDTFAEAKEELFILNKRGGNFSEEVKSEYERLKIENFMREMNRKDVVEPHKFKEYKDFSSVPTNDEIVAALRTLQNAGFGNVLNTNPTDMSYFTQNQQGNALFNMMGSQNLNPQLIQTLLTNSITQGF